MAAVLASLGNREANSVLEAVRLPSGVAKPSSSTAVPEAYIRLKYEQRRCLQTTALLGARRCRRPLRRCARERRAALLALMVQSDQLSEGARAVAVAQRNDADQPLSCELLLLAATSRWCRVAADSAARPPSRFRRCLAMLLTRCRVGVDADGATPLALAEKTATRVRARSTEAGDAARATAERRAVPTLAQPDMVGGQHGLGWPARGEPLLANLNQGPLVAQPR